MQRTTAGQNAGLRAICCNCWKALAVATYAEALCTGLPSCKQGPEINQWRPNLHHRPLDTLQCCTADCDCHDLPFCVRLLQANPACELLTSAPRVCPAQAQSDPHLQQWPVTVDIHGNNGEEEC